MRIFLTLAAMLLATSSHAGSITSTWRAPSLYTDGTKIIQQIRYRMEYAPEGAEFTQQQAIKVGTTTGTATDLAPGRWCNRIIAIVEGSESDPTPPVCVTVPAKPLPPLVKKPNPAYALGTTAAP